MHLRQLGHGKPLLLLHSLLADSRSFDALASDLASVRRVIIPDLPGYHASPPSTDAIPEVARRVMQELESIGVAEGLDVLGNGYGGFIALSLAQQFPQRVERLVLLDSAAAFPPEGRKGVQAMKESVEAGGMPAVLDTALLRLFPPAFAAANPQTIARCSAALLAMNATAFASTCRNLMEVDLREGLSRVKSRTLVVVGLEDKATPLALAREVAAGIVGASLHELPGCGHVPHVQMPEVVTPLVREFLDAA
jgi:3-oxoadipate enol-lactonase